MLAQAKAAVKDFLAANFTALPHFYPNDGNEPPQDSEGRPLPFLFVRLTSGERRSASIGAGDAGLNLRRATGILWLHIHVPTGTGDDVALAHGDTLDALFFGRELSVLGGLQFYEMERGLYDGESDDYGNYWAHVLTVTWKMDDQ